MQFVEQKGDVVTLKTAEDEHYEVPASPPLKAAMPSSLGGHSNMLHLGELHEGAILHNLRSRYTTDTVYTAISSIILSINPYKQLPCYGPGQIALYRKMLANDNADTVPAAAGNCNEVSKGNVAVPGQPLPPHVYALADQAYASLLRDQVNQAIIISGESGAGQPSRHFLLDCLACLLPRGMRSLSARADLLWRCTLSAPLCRQDRSHQVVFAIPR